MQVDPDVFTLSRWLLSEVSFAIAGYKFACLLAIDFESVTSGY